MKLDINKIREYQRLKKQKIQAPTAGQLAAISLAAGAFYAFVFLIMSDT